MKHFYIKFHLLLILSVFLLACQSKNPGAPIAPSYDVAAVRDTIVHENEPPEVGEKPFVPIEIPDAWVVQVLKHKNRLPTPEQCRLITTHAAPFHYNPSLELFRAYTANLDEDAANEIVFYLGNRIEGLVGMLDRQQNRWLLIFLQKKYARFGDDDPALIYTHEAHHLFYFATTVISGSGMAMDNMVFYKKMQNSLQQCLVCVARVGEHQPTGTGRQITSKFSVLPGSDIKITYDYHFFQDAPMENEDDEVQKVQYAKGKAAVLYRWNADSAKYVIQFLPGSKLTRETLPLFEEIELSDMEEIFKGGSKLRESDQ